MKISVIDIGSNTVKMKIFDEKINQLVSEVENAKLISYIENKNLNDAGTELLKNILVRFSELSKKNGCEKIYPFATASLRKAENREKVIEYIKEKTGLEIELLSGEDEAKLSFSGAMREKEKLASDGVFFDMGGGSTEVIPYTDFTEKQRVSLPFGSLSTLLEFSKDGITDYAGIKNKVLSHAGNEVFSKKAQRGAIVGGTAYAICKLYNKMISPDQTRLDVKLLKNLFEKIKEPDEKTLLFMKVLVPDRIDTVRSGLCAYLALFDIFGIESVDICFSGIREGYLIRKLYGENLI